MTKKNEFLAQHEVTIKKEVGETLNGINDVLQEHGYFHGRPTFDSEVPYGVARHVMEVVQEKLQTAGWTYEQNNKIGSRTFEIYVY
ncbi:hypothetical protein [Pseudoalteromonas sp. OOF1S-7]|uniref:hypothetical protein n=1 Tax=Pseudoalteromonas sp. OOF1S-7 TaxID=2917757 RepID=UPI001EF40AD0|nr:hypothetical protein [Pseudoalteromonas sp. OOF1S-7]MCG7535122.1 hypothetical protein [Pseudoalteromonas sp. OOF1S-7]